MNYIVLDLEATCWENDRSNPNEIIEIGAVKVVDGKVVDEFQRFIKPLKNPILSDFCMKLTSIKQDDVDYADGFPKVIKEFLEWIGEDYCLASWGFYDKTQLDKDCNLHKLSSEWTKPHISLKHMYTGIKGLNKHVGMARALSLEGLVLEGTHHRGIDDARNAAKIFIKHQTNFTKLNS